MWVKQALLILVLLVGVSFEEMPMSFYTYMQNDELRDVLFVKNYEAGTSLTEAYNNIEKLDRNTEVNTRSYGPDASCSIAGQGSLEASISSNVIGQAHIAWQSADTMPDSKGRHRLLGGSVEDLTGVFSVEEFIQLWSNSSPGQVSVDWLPCS